MKLETYLTLRKITHREFADLIGCEQPTVTRFLADRVPSPALMRKITEVTCGEVMPNDFFDVPSAKGKAPTNAQSAEAA